MNELNKLKELRLYIKYAIYKALKYAMNVTLYYIINVLVYVKYFHKYSFLLFLCCAK